MALLASRGLDTPSPPAQGGQHRSHFLTISRDIPAPGQSRKVAMPGLDTGPIHTSTAFVAALAARPWITVEWLPRCAPERNDIEGAWQDLKRHNPAHQTFLDADARDADIDAAVETLDKER